MYHTMNTPILLKMKPYIVQKLVFLILFCLIHSASSYSQIINEGVFHIENATTVYFGREYTNNGNYNNNGELFLNSNFINNGITTAASGTTFFTSNTNAVQSISGTTNTINFYNLTINNSLSGVSVATDFGVIVENTVDLVAGDFRLVGDAQLVQTHTGTNANSATSGSLLKDQQGTKAVYAYNYWSSPVHNGGSFTVLGSLFDGTDASINAFTPQQVLFNTGAPYNGVPSVLDGSNNVTTPLTISTRWLYTYLRDGSTAANWTKIDENTALNPGEGYTMKGTNTSDTNQNYVFKGVPNDGDYEISITNTENILIGNPYPSALDAEAFIKDNISVIAGGNSLFSNIDGTLYFWVDGGSTSHNNSDYYGGYATRNLTAGAPPSLATSTVAGLGSAAVATPPERYIAVGQGFFVEGGSAFGTTVSFNNAQRAFKTESSGESIHYKTTALEESEKSLIRIGYEDPEGFHRQLVLGFIPNSVATINYNQAYDAMMFDVRDDELFFIIDDEVDKQYVIQGVGSFDESQVFPLGLTMTEEGEHSIMLDSVENFDGTIYLKDTFLNTTHNLTAASYKVQVSLGTYLDRYQLVFIPGTTLGVDDIDTNQMHVFYNNNNSIVVNNKTGLRIDEITVYTVLGQKVLQVDQKLLSQQKITIPFDKKEGVYLIKVHSEYGDESYKILKNN